MSKLIIQANLKEQIHDVLKQNIISGQYLPGTRLVIDTLAEEFNVSRTPIRDVLHSLISRGLISQQGKGYIVFKPTRDEVKDISSLRLELEKMAVEQCILRSTDEELTFFNKFKNMDASSVRNTPLEEYDISFHEGVLFYARNKHLKFHLDMIRDLWWLIRRWSHVEASQAIKLKSMHQHDQIIDMILARNPEEAKRLMEEHHNTGLRDILESDIFE